MQRVAKLAAKDEAESIEHLLNLDYDNIDYNSKCLSIKVSFQFSDACLGTLCNSIASLPHMGQEEFQLRLGESIETMTAEELYRLVLICGPKTDLQISLN